MKPLKLKTVKDKYEYKPVSRDDQSLEGNVRISSFSKLRDDVTKVFGANLFRSVHAATGNILKRN